MSYRVEASVAADPAAADLAAYLRSPGTRQGIAMFGRGTYGDQPPVRVQ